MNNKFNVLIACEESQRTCLAFRNKGINAYSCDIQPCSGGHPEYHILSDCLYVIDGSCFFKTQDNKMHDINSSWDLIIAHPPCTYLTNAAACRLYPHKGELNTERYIKGLEAAVLFYKIYNANCKHICIENPLPSKIFNLPKPTQIIQPYYFGEPYSKKTLLWLKGLPELKYTNVLKDYIPYISCGTSKNKGIKEKAGVSRKGGSQKVRSKTFEGIAEAFTQWIDFVAAVDGVPAAKEVLL